MTLRSSLGGALIISHELRCRCTNAASAVKHSLTTLGEGKGEHLHVATAPQPGSTGQALSLDDIFMLIDEILMNDRHGLMIQIGALADHCSEAIGA